MHTEKTHNANVRTFLQAVADLGRGTMQELRAEAKLAVTPFSECEGKGLVEKVTVWRLTAEGHDWLDRSDPLPTAFDLRKASA